MKKLDSTMIDTVSYNRKERVLVIRFVNGGDYTYNNVSYHKYRSLCISESAGKYFHTAIRKFPNRYPYHKGVYCFE